MKKTLIITALFCAFLSFLPAQTGGSTYYVSATGNDENDGLTEATAFKTLSRAVIKASSSETTIKTVTVIGTLNEVSEHASTNFVFFLMNGIRNENEPILITGLPNAPSGRRAVLSATGTTKPCVRPIGPFRFEHIEISGSSKIGLDLTVGSYITLGPGSVVRNNSTGGVFVAGVPDQLKALEWVRPASLILDGGIVENNKRENTGGGIVVMGAFTMKQGSVRNNTTVSDKDGVNVAGGLYIKSNEPVSIEGGDISGNTAGLGGGVFIDEGSSVTMSGGSVSGNTATEGVGGVWVTIGATFNQRGGAISGNRAPGNTPSDTRNIYRAPGSFGTSSGSSSSSSSSSSSTPASPPRQQGGSMSVAEAPPSSGGSTSSASSRSSGSSVDVGFTAHLNVYGQGWYQNLFSFGIPLQLGMEIELPLVTLDILGEASAGMGYGNLLEYRLGGMAELYFFRKIGVGAGAGFYGNDMNLAVSAGDSKEDTVSYEPPIKTSYYRFALIFRGEYKTSLYGELYGDGKWGFGLMWGRVMTE
jgi:hypothetical protein